MRYTNIDRSICSVIIIKILALMVFAAIGKGIVCAAASVCVPESRSLYSCDALPQ